MNALSFAEMIIVITSQISGSQEALDFITKQEPKVKGNVEAQALFKISKGSILLLKDENIEAAKVGLFCRNEPFVCVTLKLYEFACFCRPSLRKLMKC